MASKLTLNINSKTVEKAKITARKKGTSVSKMVEEFLESMIEKEEKKHPIERIREIINSNITNQSLDWKKVKEEYIAKKYCVIAHP